MKVNHWPRHLKLSIKIGRIHCVSCPELHWSRFCNVLERNLKFCLSNAQLRFRCIFSWQPTADWRVFRISLRRVWYGFGTSFFVREDSSTFIVAPTQSFSLWGLKYLIVFLNATFKNSSSMTVFSFSLKAFSGRIALSQHSVPSTLFPAKTESLEMLTQNRRKCWHRISGWREAKKSIREKKEKFEEEKNPILRGEREIWIHFPQFREEKKKFENNFSNFDRGQWLRLCWCDSGLWGITESLEMLTQNR